MAGSLKEGLYTFVATQAETGLKATGVVYIDEKLIAGGDNFFYWRGFFTEFDNEILGIVKFNRHAPGACNADCGFIFLKGTADANGGADLDGTVHPDVGPVFQMKVEVVPTP